MHWLQRLVWLTQARVLLLTSTYSYSTYLYWISITNNHKKIYVSRCMHQTHLQPTRLVWCTQAWVLLLTSTYRYSMHLETYISSVLSMDAKHESDPHPHPCCCTPLHIYCSRVCTFFKVAWHSVASRLLGPSQISTCTGNQQLVSSITGLGGLLLWRGQVYRSCMHSKMVQCCKQNNVGVVGGSA